MFLFSIPLHKNARALAHPHTHAKQSAPSHHVLSYKMFHFSKIKPPQKRNSSLRHFVVARRFMLASALSGTAIILPPSAEMHARVTTACATMVPAGL